jgi:tetratricopeptide (TPR) repeat protein
MIFRSPSLLSFLLLSLTLFLFQCETGEERAEGHYQSGLKLMESGDPDRALVEFRNVFKLNEKHEAARQTYASIQRGRGKYKDSYAQYLRLVELYPNNIDGRRALGEMSIKAMKWDVAERHIRAAFELAPEDEMIKAMTYALNYRQAILDDNLDARSEAVDASQVILAANHENEFARRVVIDQLLRDEKFTNALEELENALAIEPANLEYHELKLRTLGALGNQDAIGEHLQEMFKQFPKNERITRTLIAWYIQRGELDKAEAFLRQLAEGDDETAEQAKTTIVQFLQRTKGSDAARAELGRLIATDKNTELYRGLLAVLDYETGNAEKAILDLEAVLENAEPSDQANNLKVTLAQIKQVTGNHIGARALIEEVLKDDQGNIDALKMRARWLIQDDKTSEAITTLRTALDQAPRDVDTLTLMAQAHIRDGSRNLAGERLSLAVEASNNAVEESLRYARFLIEDKNLFPAETVLINALRRDPRNVQVLKVLADIYLAQKDWGRTEGIIEQLGRINTDDTKRMANAIRSSLLLHQGRGDENIAFLQQLVDQGDASIAAAATIVQTHLRNSAPDQARNYLEEELVKAPDEPILLFLRAGLHTLQGEENQAETIYRALIADDPSSVRLIQTYYGMLRNNGHKADAMVVLDAGITATNGAAQLMWIKAGEYEQNDEFDAAIDIYEDLYEKDSSSLIVANNLASMITTHRDDAEGLERAFAIARRLRDSKVPAFQDTYGWIEYRRGNYEEALKYLVPAAAGLPKDPLTQYHLGMAYVALKSTAKARETLTRTLEIAGDSTLPQFISAREALDGLPAE